MFNLEEDLQGMNLSLQVDDLDEGDDKFDNARKEPEKVSSLSEVPFIPAGRFKPVFLDCGESISGSFLFGLGVDREEMGMFVSWENDGKDLSLQAKRAFEEEQRSNSMNGREE